MPVRTDAELFTGATNVIPPGTNICVIQYGLLKLTVGRFVVIVTVLEPPEAGMFSQFVDGFMVRMTAVGSSDATGYWAKIYSPSVCAPLSAPAESKKHPI